jgi:tetratricopeptide (TPR) repeat protein
MKICLSVSFLACAGLLWCGCATAPAHRPAAKARAPSATNAVAAEDAATEDDSADAVPTGKGNAEALAHYAAGISYETNGQHNLAVEEFYKSVLADPGNEAKALELAQQFLQEQQPQKAAALLSKVAERPDASVAILGWLARADLQAGQTNAAIAASRQAIERRPDSLEGYESQLEVLMQTGKPAEALRTLDRAARHIRNQPPDLIALANLYSVYLGTQNKDTAAARLRAAALLDRAAALKFSSPPLWERTADTYGRLGDMKKAAAIYNKLAGESPEGSLLRAALREKLAVLYFNAQDWTNATKQFQSVVRDDPVHPEAWFYLGVMAQSDRKLPEAAADFENALRWDQKLESAYYRLALVRADLNRGDDAVQILNQARARFPNSFECEFFSGLVYSQLKDYGEAVRHLAAAETMARAGNPSRLDRQFYFQMGAVYERNHQWEQAADYLQKCIDLGPDDAEALNYLGFMWADRGEHLAKARAYIEKAVKLEPKNAAYLDSLGWVLFKLKLPREALPWMLKAVEFSPAADATILDHLGDVYMALGQPGKAMETWKKSLSVESNEDVKKKLQFFDGGAT